MGIKINNDGKEIPMGLEVKFKKYDKDFNDDPLKLLWKNIKNLPKTEKKLLKKDKKEMNFNDIKIGDIVTRFLGNKSDCKMNLKVTDLNETEIICGDWKFSRINGAEIDEELGWSELYTGSYLDDALTLSE